MLDLADLADLPTFEFFTVYKKLAQMAILASKDLRPTKKGYLQWGST